MMSNPKVKRTDGRQVTKEGWLMKEGGAARTKWQSRWFRLQGRTINYFTKREDNSPQGTIHLDEVKDVCKIGEHSGKMHCLAMVTMKEKGKKVYYLSAETEELLNEWFVAFQANKAPDVPAKLVKYSTVEVFLTQGIRITGDVSYDILSNISHRLPAEKKRRDNFGWFCDRPIAVGMVLNLFAQYGWSPDHIYRSTGISGTDSGSIQPVMRIIFSKSPLDGADALARSRTYSKCNSQGSSSSASSSPQSSPHMGGSRIDTSGRIMGALRGAAGKLSTLGKGAAGEVGGAAAPALAPSAIPPDATLLEGADDELISLMEEFNIPLSLLEVSGE
jgi:hypothetical protein